MITKKINLNIAIAYYSMVPSGEMTGIPASSDILCDNYILALTDLK
jgi:hypothetical protein